MTGIGSETMTTSVSALMADIGVRARAAARDIALADGALKNRALHAMAQQLRDSASAILDANREDQAEGTALSESFRDRLMLNGKRLEAVAAGVDAVAGLADPVGRVLAEFQPANGLRIERVSTPLGVVGVIFEARPNVTADAGALCLKAGNASILRSGSSSFRTAAAIAAALGRGLESVGLSPDIIQLVPTKDRDAVGEMLKGLSGNIDVIVPRGGKSLVARVQDEARVPVFSHLEGICHTYVHQAADLDMSLKVLRNAKLRRTGICGATETLLVDEGCAPTHLAPLVQMLLDAGCEVRGDERTRQVDPRVTPAVEEDWSAEYLAAVISAKVVKDIHEAVDHIEHYGSHHTDAIITADEQA
ncbi:MAG: glutamate-5-semialdehyde dehydrogenase, partial [Methylobacteriaceae bacterium]|nr:glutamate-5-semialdehyde dehydrogenase [Methylobacteriaceae bacterium]